MKVSSLTDNQGNSKLNQIELAFHTHQISINVNLAFPVLERLGKIRNFYVQLKGI